MNKKESRGLNAPNDVTITNIFEKKKGYINPVIVTFQNGDLSKNSESEFDTTFTASESGRTEVEVKTSYGHVFKDSNCFSNESFRHLLFIRNRKTNKVKVVEVDKAVLINEALITQKRITANVSSSNEQDFKDLKRVFGGKKIMKRLEQRDKLNINTMLVTDEIKEAVAEMEVGDITSVSNTETESIINLVPPCNRAAKNVSDVYNFNQIFTPEELASLLSEAHDKFIDNKKADLQQYSPFFRILYEEVRKPTDNLENRLAGILFVETLIQFLKVPSKKLLSKKLDLCPFSSIIHGKLLNEFCIKTVSSVTRPSTIRDKSLCYIIALSLICCNYKINLKALAIETCVHFNKLSKLARTVGAVPFSKDQDSFILKLPLPSMPKMSLKKSQRR